MKIYTKGGDKGKTSLGGGTRVKKSDPKVNAYGNVDELISYIAILITSTEGFPYHKNWVEIQATLMLVASYFAADENGVKRLPPFEKSKVEFLEEIIDKMSEELPPQKSFILPGKPRAAAECHVARTICRRAERSAVALLEEEQESIELPLQYLNRLSDYLFLYGRLVTHKSGEKESYWLP